MKLHKVLNDHGKKQKPPSASLFLRALESTGSIVTEDD